MAVKRGSETFSGFNKNNFMKKSGQLSFWVNSKVYNFVENVHQIWLLSIVDRAMILSNCKIIAEGSPNNLIKNEKAKSQYFGNFFKN